VLGGLPRQPGNTSTYVNIVSPGWLSTYGLTLLAGRDIDERDARGAPPIVLANEAFVRHFLPGRSPLGCQVRNMGVRRESPPYTIVGVVNDTVYRSLRQSPPPTLFFAWRQTTLMDAEGSLSVRTAGPPVATLVTPLTTAMLAVHPDLSFTFTPLAEQVDASLSQERLIATLSSFFGVLAMLLAGIGLYGITAYDVGQRRSEVGVRMALGSAPGRVVQLMLRRVTGLVVAGLVVGSVVAYWAAGLVKTLVFGIETRDPATFLVAIVVLGMVGLLAAWLPARQASRVDPVEVLREI
jgi:putative ABC transport system permease protein